MTTRLGLNMSQHTSGIYSDMTVDGPVIGTLVVVVDRAKNLPNRRTVGKQDPYCAARLGKEAKKTETDLRGGQTPRWDQELRFTVHDSPDYHAIKVSVFNDDKKTEMIGETFVSLWDSVIIPGGGRADAWHALNYRGRYAGEVRLEMTYYDSRTPQKPATPQKSASQVRRRPLPAGPSATVVPQFGPRTMGCSRGTTVYVDGNGNPTEGPWDPTEDTELVEQPIYNNMQPDYLPQISPRQPSRASLPHGRDAIPASAPPALEHPHVQQSLPYSQSTPNFNDSAVGRYLESPYGGQKAWENDRRHSGNVYNNASSDWDHRSIVPSQYDAHQSEDYSDRFDQDDLPPLPSSQNGTPAHQRHRSLDQRAFRPSPRQTYERPLPTPSAGATRPLPDIGTPRRPAQGHMSTPNSHGQPSPGARSVGSPSAASPHHSPLPHPPLNRQSVSDPYMSTPPRAHPLSQELPRSTSPQPYHGQDGYEEPPNYHFPEDLPVARPLPIPQTPRARHSIASIRHPISTFAATMNTSPGESSTPVSPSSRVSPARKLVGSQPTTPSSDPRRSSVPFSPDSFDTYNPSARSGHLDSQPSPHNPYHIPAEPKRPSSSGASTTHGLDTSKPILGHDGRVIDPSDHLPVNSWAPEPEAKTPVKTYGGGNRTFGPRGNQVSSPPSAGTSGPRRSNLVVNVRTGGRAGMETSSPVPASSPMTGSPSTPSRNRSGHMYGNISQPDSPVLREIDPPNPLYSSSSFGRGSSGSGVHGYDEHRSRGGVPPPKPPKIPLAQDHSGYGASALSREISKIDIGSGRRGPPRGAVGARYS